MGWPLAVSSALMEQRKTSLASSIGALSLGHFLAMTAVLLPFSLLYVLVYWEDEIRIGAGVIVICLGIYLLIVRKTSQISIESFPNQAGTLVVSSSAMAHGAGLMLVPIYLGICAVGANDTGHMAAGTSDGR